LYKFKCKSENRIKKLQLDFEYNHRTKWVRIVTDRDSVA
jgi:hypothetical protein